MKCALKINKERKIRERAVEEVVEFMVLATIQFLGDKRGWKKDSIAKYVTYIYRHAEALVDGYTTLDEVREAVLEDYGFRFENGSVYYYDEDKRKALGEKNRGATV